MKKPNFFIVGKPKTGTRTLHYFLRQHPDIFLPKKQEMHHFEQDMHEKRHRLGRGRRVTKRLDAYHLYRKEDYLAHYDRADGFKAVGDNSPSYLYSTAAAKEIAAFNPQAKIIASFREPVSFLYSFHSQAVWELDEPQEDFRKALALEKQRKEQDRLLKNGKHISYLYYSERVKYAEQLQRFLDMFPREQIKVTLFDDFVKDNLGVFRELLKFLEVDVNFTPELEKKNPNKAIRFKALREAARKVRDSGLPEMLPGPMVRLMKRGINAATTMEERREPLDKAFEKELKQRFRDEVIAFNRLLHKHKLVEKDIVSLWGYA